MDADKRRSPDLILPRRDLRTSAASWLARRQSRSPNALDPPASHTRSGRSNRDAVRCRRAGTVPSRAGPRERGMPDGRLPGRAECGRLPSLPPTVAGIHPAGLRAVHLFGIYSVFFRRLFGRGTPRTYAAKRPQRTLFAAPPTLSARYPRAARARPGFVREAGRGRRRNPVSAWAWENRRRINAERIPNKNRINWPGRSARTPTGDGGSRPIGRLPYHGAGGDPAAGVPSPDRRQWDRPPRSPELSGDRGGRGPSNGQESSSASRRPHRAGSRRGQRARAGGGPVRARRPRGRTPWPPGRSCSSRARCRA